MILNYSIKNHPQSRRIRLTIKRDGQILVTKPKRASIKMAEAFIESKRQWIENCLKKLADKSSLANSLPTKEDFLANRYKFQRRLREKIERINAFYGFKYALISVKNQQTRLGSCSRRGNLNFSYRLSVYSDEIIDYVVVHELCHLKEFNHSKNFWALVEKAVPNYREIRKKLKIF